jgi:hypothetical protein
MATKLSDLDPKGLKDASRFCRLAIEDCEALLKRTEEMLRRSQQDNLRH